MASDNPDQVRVSISVAVPPDEAFRLFTTCVDQWWRQGVRFRNGGRDGSTLHLEPRLDGRLFEVFTTRAGQAAPRPAIEIGRVLAWEPPTRLVLRWRNSNFAPEERTEVEVAFAPSAGPVPSTRVTVIHRGWSTLRPDHPARHGLPGPAFSRMMGMWWADQLTSLRLLGAPADPSCRPDAT